MKKGGNDPKIDKENNEMSYKPILVLMEGTWRTKSFHTLLLGVWGVSAFSESHLAVSIKMNIYTFPWPHQLQIVGISPIEKKQQSTKHMLRCFLLCYDGKLVGNIWLSVHSEAAEYIMAFKDYEIRQIVKKPHSCSSLVLRS